MIRFKLVANQCAAAAMALRNALAGACVRVPRSVAFITEDGAEKLVRSNEKPPYRTVHPYGALTTKPQQHDPKQVRCYHGANLSGSVGKCTAPFGPRRETLRAEK